MFLQRCSPGEAHTEKEGLDANTLNYSKLIYYFYKLKGIAGSEPSQPFLCIPKPPSQWHDVF